MSDMKSTGIIAAISAAVTETTVKPICCEPRIVASSALSPSSIRRIMFSMTITASSTTKPVAIVNAIRDRLSSEKLNRYIAPSVAASDTGIVMAGIRVAVSLLRKTEMITTTRTTAISSVCSTS